MSENFSVPQEILQPFQRSWVIRFSIVQIVRTKMVAEVVRRAGVKILKCFWQNTPWPDTGKNVLIVQPYLVKFYFLGWRSSMATLSRSSMLTFVVSRTRLGDSLFNLVQFSGLINHPFSAGPFAREQRQHPLPENISEVNWNQSCSALFFQWNLVDLLFQIKTQPWDVSSHTRIKKGKQPGNSNVIVTNYQFSDDC